VLLSGDAGVVPEIGDYVWLDTNGNGVQDVDESGVENVTVNLRDRFGDQLLDTTVTDQDGRYGFIGLDSDEYVIEVVLPDGFVFTDSYQGSDEQLDSDVQSYNGQSYSFFYSSGENDIDIDAGLQKLVDIQGNALYYGDLTGDVIVGVSDVPLDQSFPSFDVIYVSDVDVDTNMGTGLITRDDGFGLLVNTSDQTIHETDLRDCKYKIGNEGGWYFGGQFVYNTYYMSDMLPGQAQGSVAENTQLLITGLESGETLIDIDAQFYNMQMARHSPGVEGTYHVTSTISFGNRTAQMPTTLHGSYSGIADYTVNEVSRVSAGIDLDYEQATGDAGAFSINLPTGEAPLWVNAFLDVNGNGLLDDSEPYVSTPGSYDDISSGLGNISLIMGTPPATGSIGDRVWQDSNANGIQDAGEPGIAGVTVNLLDDQGDVLDSTQTDSDGGYVFNDLPDGSYSVDFDLPVNYVFTQTNVGDDDSLDSDADAQTGLVSDIQIVNGITDDSVDAGMLHLASVSGLVWEDLLVDGQRDDDDLLLEGFTVELYDAVSNLLDTTLSDANGAYAFTGLDAGTYIVNFPSQDDRNYTLYQLGDSQSDSDASPIDGRTAQIVLGDSEQISHIDAGFAPTGRIEIDVWWDFNKDGLFTNDFPAGGTRITLSRVDGQRTLTAFMTNSKQANFVDLAPGDYQITITPPSGKMLTYQDQGDDDTIDSDFDRVTNTMFLTLADGQVITDLGAGMMYIPPSRIGDRVWIDTDYDGIQDDDEPGLGGVTVNLLDNQGTEIGATVTDSQGYYSFTYLDEGDYQIQLVLPSGYAVTDVNQGDEQSHDSDIHPDTLLSDTITIIKGVEDHNQDIGLIELGQISGRLFDDEDADGIYDYSEEALTNVTVYLDANDNAQLDWTDANDNGYWDSGEGERWTVSDYLGVYRFDELTENDYVIRQLTPQNYTLITPDDGQHAIHISRPPGAVQISDADMTYRGLGSVQGVVWEDINGDGWLDDDEPTMAGVTVMIGDYTTNTDQQGRYLFEQVFADTYSLRMQLPDGYTYTQQHWNSYASEDIGSDVNPTLGSTPNFTVEIGEAQGNIDVGLVAASSINGIAWNDANKDGIQDDDELGVAGVTVKLYNVHYSLLIQTTVTDDLGRYVFDGLSAEDYFIKFDLPDYHLFTTQYATADTSIDSDVDRFTFSISTFTLEAQQDLTGLDAGLIVLSDSGTLVGFQDFDDVTTGQLDGALIKDRTYNNHYNRHIADAGDINGDGFDDFLISITNIYHGYDSMVGQTYLIYGSDTLTDDDYSLGNLDNNGFDGATFTGINAWDYLGSTITGIGDTNGDGFDDLIISALEHDPLDAGGGSYYLLYGSAQGLHGDIDLADISAGTLSGAVFHGGEYRDFDQQHVAGVGDVNGDGLADFAIVSDGRFLNDNDGDVVYLIDGNATKFEGDIQLTDVGTQAVPGTQFLDAGSGMIAGAGDFNGDGLDDLLISRTHHDFIEDFNDVVLLYGKADGFDAQISMTNLDALDLSADVILDELQWNLQVHAIGDMNGDGLDDLAINSFDVSNNPTSSGTTYIVYGTTSGLNGDMDVKQLDQDQRVGAVLHGIEAGDRAGSGIKSVGDFNGDGINDLLMNSLASGKAGGFYMVYGVPGGWHGDVQLAGLFDGSLMGAMFTYATYSAAGDVNGDGFDDLLATWTAGTTVQGYTGLIYGHGRSVTSYVWEDVNKDGLRDDDEPGLAGVTVHLLNASDQIIDSTVTDANGMYSFTGMSADDYRLQFVPIAGYVLSMEGMGINGETDSDVDALTGKSDIITLTNSQYIDNVSAGMYRPGTISGIAWEDLDADGYQDDNEPVMAGVSVYLMSVNDQGINIIAGITNSQGYYEFTNLEHNQYTLSFTSPQGYLFTEKDTVGDDTADSDVDPLTGATDEITIDYDQIFTAIDAGLMPVANIGDRIWDDINANGIQDDDEPGLVNITVNLLNASGNVLQTTRTDSDGFYAFTDILASTYRVSIVVPNDYILTAYQQGSQSLLDSDLDPGAGLSDLFTLGAGDHLDIDAGLVLSPAIYHSGVIDMADIPNGYLDGALFEGFEAGAMTGSAVSNAGDVNGDGFDDFLIATNRADQYRGATHLIYGKASGLQAGVDLNGVLDGSVDGAVFYGASSSEYSGQSISSVGDLNGDGLSDLIISTSYAGRTYLVYGRQSGLTGAIDLDDVSAGNIAGAVFNGLNGERAGWDVSDAGDVNGDGLDDLLITTDESSNSTQSGNTYLVYGQTQEFVGNINLSNIESGYLDGAVFNFDMQVDNYGVGSSVSTAGDVNGDGYDDLIIGMTYASPHINREGQVFLIYGQETSLTGKINLSGVINGQVQGAVFNGIDELDFMGENVSDAGDVNADGYDDLLIYSRYGNAHGFVTGEVFLIYGQADALTGELELTDVTNGLIKGALFTGTDGYDWAGSSIDGAGDVNGDGIDDFIIGVRGDESKGIYTGAVYLIYGTTSDFSGTVDLIDVQTGQVDGAVFLGIEEGDQVGRSCSFAGDVNADGLSDIVIGATWADSLGNFTGQALLVYGQGTGISDRVWEDYNINGVQDDDEPGIAGVTVTLFDDSENTVATTVTNADGDYAFGNLTTGDYRVGFELLDGYTFTTQNVGADDDLDSDVDAQTGKSDIITLTNGQYIDTLDAGMYFTTVADAGDAYQPYEGYPIQFDASGTQTHSPNAQYAWDLDLDGQYDDATGIAPALTWSNILALGLPSDSSTMTIALQVTDEIGTYVDQTTLQIINIAPSIHSGTLYHVDYGGTVTLNASATDAGDDDLRIEWDLDGDGITGETGADATRGDEVGLTPTFNSSGLAANSLAQVTLHVWDDVTQSTTGAHIIISPASSIGDRVWHDLNANDVQDENEPGMAGVTVNLLDESQHFMATTTTDGDGNYLFDNLVTGDYRIEVVAPVGYGFTPTDSYSYSIEAGHFMISPDFSIHAPHVPGVVRGTAITADDQIIFKSRTPVISLGVDDQNNAVDVGLYQAASFAGTTWHDLNGDAIQQDTESIMAGVTVYMDDNDNQQLDWTDANSNNFWDAGEGEMWTQSADDGSYSFTSLIPGTYNVAQITPVGYEQIYIPRVNDDGHHISLVSATADHQPGNAGSLFSAISSDGRWIVYETMATNLNGSDEAYQSYIMIYDVQTGQTERLGEAFGIADDFANSGGAYISSDGRYVSFSSGADGLIAADTNGRSDVFVFDRQEGVLEMVSITSNGLPSNANSYSGPISGDGRYVLFVSDADNLVPEDTNQLLDLFVYDRQTGQLKCVNVTPEGVPGNGSGWGYDISEDGRYIVFQSSASNLVLGDTNNQADIFLYDQQTNSVTRVSVALDGTEADSSSNSPAISGDGRYVFYSSSASNLVEGDDNNMTDLFMYDMQTGDTRVISNLDVPVTTDFPGFSIGSPGSSYDGRFVTFQTNYDNLVPGDTNNHDDIFVYDTLTGEMDRVSLTYDGQQVNDIVFGPTISDDGRYVTFYSYADAMVPEDTNGMIDVYLVDRFNSHVTVELSSGQIVTDVNFGNFSPVISDQVWFDENANGVQDESEAGIADVTVNLLDVQGDLLTTTTTDSDGQYMFAGLFADDYIVEFELPTDYVFTQQHAGDDDAIDSDADVLTGRSSLITLGDDQVIANVDAGMMPAFELTREQLFYNSTVFDNNGSAVDANDDNAIDNNLTALRSGQTATGQNYTTSRDGITGIMIDGDNLHIPGISADDFIFKVGNDDSSDQWTDAPAPTQVLALPGQGIGGSDRLVITWEDGSIVDQWLQVTIRFDGQVNVAQDEAFYFGSCIGDVTGDGFVGIRDVFSIWHNRLEPGSGEQANAGLKYDLNHDGWVTISDVFLAWNHRKEQGIHDGLRLIQPTSQQQVQSLSAESRLAMALSSLPTGYSLSVVDDDQTIPALQLTEVDVADYLLDDQ
tara:strand:+ start:9212 stop:20929 length:11718 start_codon:yes stop_codon:yes gene_type:complete